MSSFSVSRRKTRPRKLLLTVIRRTPISPTISWAQAWMLKPRRIMNASVVCTPRDFTFWPPYYSPGHTSGYTGRGHEPTAACGIIYYSYGCGVIISEGNFYCSTAMLCAAIMTDHWEHVVWDRALLTALANASNIPLQWLLDEKVAKIDDMNYRKGIGTFLVPMNGGIWTMCVSLEEEETSILTRIGFPIQPMCTNYLADSDDDEPRADWQHRMQNLSISCALVCLIVLGSAALVGSFGLCKHQISAVLITGVMYLLAGLFAMFTLMIIHFKRVQRSTNRSSPHVDDTDDGVVGPRPPAMLLLSAREFSTSWSLELGWGGVVLATTTSLFWIMLSKIMRYNPISAMLL